jgi:membrane protein
MRPADIWCLLKDAALGWSNHSIARLGAALSFYTVFALSPLFLIVVFIGSLWFQQEVVQRELFLQLSNLVGTRGAEAVHLALTASMPKDEGVLASSIAIATLLVTSTGLFIELQTGLNVIWGVKERVVGVRSFVRDRLLSFGIVIGSGFLFLVSLLVSAVLTAFGNHFTGRFPRLNDVWPALNWFVSFGVITVLFAMMFKLLPDVRIRWRDVWIGAAITALLFTLGKHLLGLYLGHNAMVSAYGAAGSVILLLLWVYYSAQIFFFGAELTRAFALSFSHVSPKANAEWVDPAKAPACPAQAATVKHVNRSDKLVEEVKDEVDKLREEVDKAHNHRAGRG